MRRYDPCQWTPELARAFLYSFEFGSVETCQQGMHQQGYNQESKHLTLIGGPLLSSKMIVPEIHMGPMGQSIGEMKQDERISTKYFLARITTD
jgi:hypothetical protein